MKSSILLIFLIVCTTSYGLSCINHDNSISVYFDEYDYHEFEEEFTHLVTEQYDNDSLCYVTLFIDHTDQILEVWFGPNPELMKLTDQQVLFDTYILLDDDNDFRVKNFLDCVCLEDGCEKIVVMNHIKWFLQTSYTELHMNIIDLVIDDNIEPGQCFINLTTVQRCSIDVCGAEIYRKGYENEPEVFQGCIDDYKISMGLVISTFLNLTTESREDEYIFRCEYDRCNSDKILMNLVNLIEQYRDISPMLKILNFEIPSTGNKTTISSTISSTSVHTTTQYPNITTYTTSIATIHTTKIALMFCLILHIFVFLL